MSTACTNRQVAAKVNVSFRMADPQKRLDGMNRMAIASSRLSRG